MISGSCTNCCGSTCVPGDCASIEQAVDGNNNTMWNPQGSGAFVIQFQYSTYVAPQAFYIATSPGDTVHDRLQWTVLAGNASGQYTYTFPTVAKVLGSSPKILDLTAVSPPIYARYWTVQTNTGPYQLYVFEMYFAYAQCRNGYACGILNQTAGEL